MAKLQNSSRPLISGKLSNRLSLNMASKKRLRITRSRYASTTPPVIIKRGTFSGTIRTFQFELISVDQQMRERNRAYNFFSIN